MENSLVPKTKQVEHIFLTEVFKKLCPFYMSIGMTYEQFWYEDIDLAKYYLEAYRIKEKREAEKTKWIIWQQGAYIYEALCDVSPILRPFSKEKKPLRYPKRPYGLEDTQKEILDQEELKEKQLLKTQIYFQNWARNMQKRFKE